MQQVHFLQIWAQPSKSGLTPNYFTRHFTDAEKTDTLLTIVAPVGAPGVTDDREGSGPTPVQSPVTLKATILNPLKIVSHEFTGEGERKAYVHVVQTSGYNTKAGSGHTISVNGQLELKEGDGAFAWGKAGEKLVIENVGEGQAEVLVFDIE